MNDLGEKIIFRTLLPNSHEDFLVRKDKFLQSTRCLSNFLLKKQKSLEKNIITSLSHVQINNSRSQRVCSFMQAFELAT